MTPDERDEKGSGYGDPKRIFRDHKFVNNDGFWADKAAQYKPAQTEAVTGARFEGEDSECYRAGGKGSRRRKLNKVTTARAQQLAKPTH